ncbi:uncharacterized protein LOC143538495 [Bidens hawaiensis]|uniref:uncharacterized protein LOC143538495 n=1 Tax=Bidens hawaiensis TaxID=980011 RepID=UPI00404A4153
MAITNAPETTRHKPHQTMDDYDKVKSLKSLNDRLLKETTEKRQQVDSLVQKNTYLESEVNRTVMENDELKSEMGLLTEALVRLEIEKDVVFVYLNVQLNQLMERLEDDLKRVLEDKSEIERVKREKESEIAGLNKRLSEFRVEIDEERAVSARVSDKRDAIKVLLEGKVLEVNELKVKVAKIEEKEARVLTEVAELKEECDRLKAENVAGVMRVELVMKEKEDVQARLVESDSMVDGLRRDVANLVEEKKVIADEKAAQDDKNSELQGLEDELRKLVERMRTEEGILRERIADLEKKYAASLDNEVEMKSRISELVEEKKETERRIECLVNEKSLVLKDLQGVMDELQQQKLAFEQVIERKTELENVKTHVENEIVKKDEQLSACKDTISSLEQSNFKHIEKVKELEIESGSYKSLLDQVTVEKDEVVKQLNDQKAVADDLNQTITSMKMEIQDLNLKLSALTAVNEENLGEKNRLTDQCAGLVKEVADLEARFAENRVELEGKLSAAEANLNQVLNMLKKTVMVCEGTGDFDQENGVEDEIKEHVAGIEAIKRALMDKESRLEEMKMQVELVKSSAKKEKGFWTMVSSATTLLAAAASLAYVARAH